MISNKHVELCIGKFAFSRKLYTMRNESSISIESGAAGSESNF